MKTIHILRICKVKGAQVETTDTYAFEEEKQADAIIAEISKDPNCRVGQNPGTLIFKEAIPFFESTDMPKVNSSKSTNIDIFRKLSGGQSLPWFYKRPFR